MSAPYGVQQRQSGYMPQPLRRDPDLWFFDGNVVLVAQGIVAFRVHKGVLAHHSDVFRSWFTEPVAVAAAGNGITELCEGAQVVRLRFNDTAHDIKQALLMMYGLRFSTDLEERDTLSDECCVSFDLGDKQAIEAYNVFKLSDNGYIFMAVYLCAQLPVEVLHAGTRRVDGTPKVLSEPDLQIILKAKAQLKELSAKILAECYKTRSSNGFECPETGCEDAFYDVMFPKGPGAQRLADGDVASRWVLDCIDELRSDERICEECAQDARERHEGLREAIWEEYMENVEVPENHR